jgi:hypothetical protein
MMYGLYLPVADVAYLCHEVNRAYCVALGDRTQPPWEEVERWQRDSAFEGVRNILQGKVLNPGDSHAYWCAHKKADGWVYGAQKDPLAKTHPCLVPFTELSLEQRVKDYLFFHTARAALFLGHCSL